MNDTLSLYKFYTRYIGNMDTNVQITLIVAAAIVLIIALYFNRGRLKRLGLKLDGKGVEVEAQMSDDSQNPRIEEGAAEKKKVVAEGIVQDGDRDVIEIKGQDVQARNIEVKGNDNKIKIG